MVSTRSADGNHKANGSPAAAAGEKHNLDKAGASSPSAKRTKTEDDKGERQLTLEETMSKPDDKDGNDKQPAAKEDTSKKETVEKEDTAEDVKQALEETNGSSKTTETAVEPHADPDVPSTVLEKGILYFFFRPRVNIDHPEEVDDIARTYIILRPMAADAGLGSGPIGDAGNSRVLAVPKKTLPQSGRERYMVFVNRTGTSFETLKNEFLEGEKRETKTRGTTTVPEAVPAAEGVYLLTSNGRESHLAYAITRPKELGEVQQDLGLKKQGSFILSTRNPKFPAPNNAQLPEGPEFSQEYVFHVHQKYECIRLS